MRGERLRPSRSSVALIQEMIATVRPDSSDLQDWARTYASSHATRLAFDLDLTRQHVKPGASVLEVGSVPLLLTGALQKSGYRVTGVDIDPSRYTEAIAALGLNVLRTNVETEGIPLPDSSVDCILFNEVFEHLRINIIATFRSLIRVLRPGGVMFVSTPNLRCATTLFRLTFSGYVFSVYGPYSKLESLGHMGHVRLYTAAELAQFLTKMGLEVESVIYRGAYSSGLAKRMAWSAVPAFKPMFSILATKPGQQVQART